MGRYIIHGAGGVGGLLGARLSLTGHEVVLIARGAHRAALAERGLTFRTPAGEQVLRLATAGSAAELSIGAADTVVLAMKTQDSAGALRELAGIAPRATAIVCAQNGLESERLALRLFDNVYGAGVFVYAAVTAPGVVACYSHPGFGVIDLGRYPEGLDARAEALAGDLSQAGFAAEARADVMAWKRGKLLINTGNAVQAAAGVGPALEPVIRAAREEGERVFAAAGLPFVPAAEILARGQALAAPQTVDGQSFPGGSTLQGMARGAADSEVDYLNGEIALIARAAGEPAPVNAFLQRLMRERVAARAAPASMPAEDLLARLAAETAG
jgi:2-dehydropantoate 2-reductase